MNGENQNGGSIALSGYIFQTLYAIVLSMREEWDLLKVEPITPNDKTDIMLIEKAVYDENTINGVDIHLSGKEGTYKNIQVKKRKDPVSQKELDEWCKGLLKDGQEYQCEMCLFGKLSKGVKVDRRVKLTVLDNDIEVTESMVKQKIADYCELKDAKDYSEKDLDDAYSLLFRLLMMNSINEKPVTKEQIEKLLKSILETSPENRAAIIKLTSEHYFLDNPEYKRDLRPARLDNTGKNIIMDQRLSHDELPQVQEGRNIPVNLLDYFAEHVKDDSVTRHIYLSATSGMGKSTCLYDLWEKYLEDDSKIIPVYIPLIDVNESIKTYILNQFLTTAGINSFEWLKTDFQKSSYHIVILLDGYNELTGNDISQLNAEIGELLSLKGVTVIITSRDPKMDPKQQFKKDITKLKLCPLTKTQISSLLGGNKEILKKNKYDGVLTNPFMLEICIKTYAGDISEKLSSINLVPMEMLLQEYINKQMKDNDLSIENEIILTVILPLVTMKLDKRSKDEAIGEDPKSYRWEDFNITVESVQNGIDVYKRSIAYCIGERSVNVNYVDSIKKIPDLTTSLINEGVKLEVFSSETKNGKSIKWDHEIYRDYFTARGYALFASVHEDSEDCIHDLAKQINYRYPEPQDAVDEVIRGYHVQKAQMFIDMVDSRLLDDGEFNEEDFERLKKTATYRRLVRDVAFIYEDMNDIRMGTATDLCMKYYSDDPEIYDRNSKYDYDSKMRRYADAAYSLSALAYNYTHLKVAEGDKEKEKEKLNNAKYALEKSSSLFRRLDPEIKKIRIVKDDMVKYNGNCAAYNLGMYRIEKDEEYVKKALKAHEDNLTIRLEIKKEFGDKEDINRNIAVSYAGIATCNYYLRNYREAIRNHDEAINIRPKNNISPIFNSYRRIIGCYAEMEDYTPDDARQAIERIIKTLNYVNAHNTLQDYEKMSEEIVVIMNKLPEAVKLEEISIQNQKKTYSQIVEDLMISISNKSFNM